MQRKIEGEAKEWSELREKIIGLLDAEEQRRVRASNGAMAYVTSRAIAITIAKKHQISAEEAVKIYDRLYSDSARCDLTVKENAENFENAIKKRCGKTAKTMQIMLIMRKIGQEEGLKPVKAAYVYQTEMAQHGMGDLTKDEYKLLYRQLCGLYANDAIF